MKKMRLVIMMMAMALVMVSMLCSCNAAGGSDSYEAPAAHVSEQNSESVVIDNQETESPFKAKAVLSGSCLTFYYDDKDHSAEGKVYPVSSEGYNSKGNPWKDAKFYIVKFDDSCKEWAPESLAYFFSDCGSAISIDCTNLNTANVTSMNRMFNNCSSLVAVNMTSLDTSKLENMSNMFRNCITLISADLRNFRAEAIDGSYGIFTGCNASVTR